MDDLVFLITTPESDEVVFYSSRWSKEIIDEAKKQGIKVTNLEKEKANQTNFQGHIKKQNPDFIMFNGHGTSEFILGHNEEILLEKDKDELLTKGRIIYARSCSSLSELGVTCTKSGARVFVGYSLPFSFVSDPNRSAHPLKDELAAPCLTTSNGVALSIIKGKTVIESVEKAKMKMNELIGYWETRDDVVEAPFVATCLHWNKLALGYEGDGNARLITKNEGKTAL